MKEVVTQTVMNMRNIYLENNHKNREFVKRARLLSKYSNVNFVLLNIFRLRGRFSYFMLSTLPTTGQVITARLALGDVHDRQVERSRTIKTGCTANTGVPFTTLEISDLGTAINNFEDQHGALRDEAYTVLNNMLKNVFLTRIQTAANAAGIGAIALIQSCGCIVQGVGGKKDQVFDCFDGIASGTVMLIAPAGGNNTCHDWWYSHDQITWVRMSPTIHANTMKSGLTAGEKAYFRHELINGEGGTGISQIISIMVK